MSMEQNKEYHLNFPGNWIEHEDRNWAYKIHLLLSLVESQFSEAVVAHGLYKSVTPSDYRKLLETWNDENTKCQNRLRSMYAKLYVYALDGVGKLLRVLGEGPYLPNAAKMACEGFEFRFGIVREIRNSLQHIEDRARGLGPHNKIIDANVFVLGNLVNNRFCATLSGGRCGEIEISEDVLIATKDIIQNIINSFGWIGLGDVRIPPKI